ncbi:right-handed parallel beta-helix repeat-containing protein [Candidatus Saccharibacteria bacterium]|nr:right-handed parallel beta-helix repeat-containing protein [Candidatus Saccharibacteria bacterium]
MTKKSKHIRQSRYNFKLSLILLLIPLAVGAFTVTAIFNGLYSHSLADLGSSRLETKGWQSASDALIKAQPVYERKFAYHKVEQGQTLEEIAQYFSVDRASLLLNNPGKIVAGTTIKITPVERPLEATAGPNGAIGSAIVTQDDGMLRITNKYKLDHPIVTNLPDLAGYLAPYGAIEQTGPKTFRINKAISLDGDIRLDLTNTTVTKLELLSTPDQVTCLCMDGSSVLIDTVEISSIDPNTKKPDIDPSDGRSFVRMKNGRMDILHSKITYLGNGTPSTLTAKAQLSSLQREGGVYGTSWRTSDNQLGSQVVTGWVEDNQFAYNHFGAYSYGVSGMLWRGNHFYKNDIYGLDPHDDSNNALIENNVFESNGRHGFIVSKRCNYNVVRNNTSLNNKFHGFMLHQDSSYNLVEDNIAYGNVDNYVIYASNFNTVRNNLSYIPSTSHVRINEASSNNFVIGNKLYGGIRGIYLYDGVNTTYIANNELKNTGKELQTKGANNTFFGGNILGSIDYDIAPEDNLVFGVSRIDRSVVDIPTNPPLPKGYKPWPRG